MGASMAERLVAPDIRLFVFDTRKEAMEPFVKRGATLNIDPKGFDIERAADRNKLIREYAKHKNARP